MFTVTVNYNNIYQNAVKLTNFGKICAVVKANAYGHGAVKVAKTIEEVVECFAVATTAEALELAESGIRKDIIVFCAEDLSIKLPPNIIPSVWCAQQVSMLNRETTRLAIKVNTGMNRYGCTTNILKSLYELCIKLGKTVHSVYSHFYNTNELERVQTQFDKFVKASSFLPSTIKKHVASTSALKYKDFSMDFARVGLGLYGYGLSELRPAMKVSAPVTQISRVLAGEHIGYGEFVAQRKMTIATLRIGYADGLLRRYGNLCFTINGVACPIVGTPCMDACFVDVSKVRAVVGNEAILFQSQRDMEKICSETGTIPYEILATFGHQRKRSFISE